MTEAIVVAIIVLIGNVIVALISQRKTAREVEYTIQTNQAVTETKLDEITREVRSRDGMIQQVPVMQEQIKGLDKRVGDLERKVS